LILRQIGYLSFAEAIELMSWLDFYEFDTFSKELVFNSVLFLDLSLISLKTIKQDNLSWKSIGESEVSKIGSLQLFSAFSRLNKFFFKIEFMASFESFETLFKKGGKVVRLWISFSFRKILILKPNTSI
jgi:hypothetical protein